MVTGQHVDDVGDLHVGEALDLGGQSHPVALVVSHGDHLGLLAEPLLDGDAGHLALEQGGLLSPSDTSTVVAISKVEVLAST